MRETTSTKIVDEKTVTTKTTKTTTTKDGVTETKTVIESEDQSTKKVAPHFTSNLECLIVNEREQAQFV